MSDQRGSNTVSGEMIRSFIERVERKRAGLERVVASVSPHPDLGKPALWASEGHVRERDRAIDLMPWPLPRASEVVEPASPPSAEPPPTVVNLRAPR